MTKIVGSIGALWLLVCAIALSFNAPLPFSGATQDFGSKARVVTDAFVEAQLNK
ncbi:hypothetical protein G0029_06670 [Acinetobacter sp. YH12138]|uniref:hypothetical protein n=1 Tax=Acinetobacter sp. YH12138 TaxID=2601122 RepID=UPI0015D3ABB1|nr:hypothetical protein [Acinetobacter sp. YH12138]QOW49504.1 hypothetical protein G0029_06670 [Acinetobacter sp. YH12138]